jgi:hypothetical protein
LVVFVALYEIYPLLRNIAVFKCPERRRMFMGKEMNRRDFLNATAVTGTLFLGLAQGLVKTPVKIVSGVERSAIPDTI